jgi:hypothetical protein
MLVNAALGHTSVQRWNALPLEHRTADNLVYLHALAAQFGS